MEIMRKCTGKVITTGMGKVGIIANKLATTLSSTGTPACFLHPGEAAHGDLGLVNKHDVMITFSNSGKTREVIPAKHIQGKIPAIAAGNCSLYPFFCIQ